jgi:V8-like Glu-specific endopeptidase
LRVKHAANILHLLRKMKTSLVSALAFALAVVSCASESDSSSESAKSTSAAIVGGAADTNDPAVVYILIQHASNPTVATSFQCSGIIVSPHVVLTAAHCLDPSIIGTGQSFYVFTGDNNNDNTEANDSKNYVYDCVPHFDPAFDKTTYNPVTNPSSAHDIAVLVTPTAMTPAPLPMNRASLDASLVGTQARVLGYGLTAGGDAGTSGQRFERTVSISRVDDENVIFQDTTCEGDSGGPTLATINGQEVVVGVHSYGEHDTSCTGDNYDERIDKYASTFVDPFIETADPGFLESQTPDVDAAVDDGDASITSAAPSSSSSSSGCNVSRAKDRSDGFFACGALVALAAAMRRRRRTRRDIL